jgi:hypothetical protein
LFFYALALQIYAFILQQKTRLQHYAKNRCEFAAHHCPCLYHVASEQTSFALIGHSQRAKFNSTANSSEKYCSATSYRLWNFNLKMQQNPQTLQNKRNLKIILISYVLRVLQNTATC